GQSSKATPVGAIAKFAASGKKIRKKDLDDNGHLVLYPGSACETYKMANNASSTIAGYSEHAAIVHYTATPETCSVLKPEGFLLLVRAYILFRQRCRLVNLVHWHRNEYH
ncbi:hypothetical protein D0T50_13615, partial [Bacteroides sp. 214]|uniref:hypothetical protein n=1 Tax=Bacteroides sp. 214 TaxID=2302935 RepID=UPI0013D764FF